MDFINDYPIQAENTLKGRVANLFEAICTKPIIRQIFKEKFVEDFCSRRGEDINISLIFDSHS